MKKNSVFWVILLALCFVSSAVWASPITLSGITFAEQTGAFTITGGSGTGTTADPFVLYEDVVDLDITMSITGLPGFGDQAQVDYEASFWLTKVVTNLTGEIWNFFDHELQETLGTPSPEADGLTFAQGASWLRPWYSDKFSSFIEETVDRDFINFYDGIVNPGETVIFSYVISDNSPIPTFYLRQRPNYEAPGVPVPAAIWLLGSGLLGLIGLRKKIKN